MTRLPDSPRPPAAPPERRLTPEQFEQVIRRAAELQARTADESAQDGITETELIRIGREIGISPQHIQRALAEAGGAATGKRGLPERVFGPRVATAGRTVPGDAPGVRAHLDRYLVERERLGVVRRFGERAVYRRRRGLDVAAVVASALDGVGVSKQPHVGAGFKLREAGEVHVEVQPLEEGYSYVSIQVDLANYRTGLGAGGSALGVAGSVGVATVLAVAVDPAAALLGLPILPGSLWGFRAIQRHMVDHAQTHIESLLDCLERGEPLVRAPLSRR